MVNGIFPAECSGYTSDDVKVYWVSSEISLLSHVEKLNSLDVLRWIVGHKNDEVATCLRKKQISNVTTC